MKFLSVIAFSLLVLSVGARAEEATHGAAAESHGEEAQHGGGHEEKPYDLSFVKQPVSDVESGTAPTAPKLQSPEALAKVGTNVTLKWGEVKGAELYHIQVATDPNFKWLIVDEANFPQTSFQPQGLNVGQNYFWRVAARKPGNYASYTKSFFSSSSFTTK